MIAADGQVTINQSGLTQNTFTRQQQDLYGHYNPLTDPNNTPWAKFKREIGLDQLEQVWGDPNATWQDKGLAILHFIGTNANNLIQLGLILGGPEDEGVIAAEEEGSGLVIKLGEGESSHPAFPTDSSQLDHIFRVKDGHFPDDTLANRQAILGTIDNSNYVGTDSNGVEWYTQNLPNGQQIWVSVRNGVIQNAGINNTPRFWDTGKQRLVGY